MSEPNPFFDSLSSILSTKKYWMKDEYFEKQYAPIGVNIGLSQHVDCILHVNELNKFWQVLTPRMHYDYCFYTIRKMFRPFKKWSKHTKDEDIEAVMEYFQVNRNKARDYLGILTGSQLAEMKGEAF